jgi:hypothetical protein
MRLAATGIGLPLNKAGHLSVRGLAFDSIMSPRGIGSLPWRWPALISFTKVSS